ncbi:hypothetical protein VDG1235_2519 [Verrucomicrobiia bacterium DG1235]|nr:hypothetical protein VDG1235_2519 [Verrucomicrobiae bacterium DG1235]
MFVASHGRGIQECSPPETLLVFAILDTFRENLKFDIP